MREYRIMSGVWFVILLMNTTRRFFSQPYKRLGCIRYAPMRSSHPGIFMRDFVTGIFQSAVFLAELSAKSANVFYELGLVHAYRSRCPAL